MVYRKIFPVKFAAIFLAFAAISPVTGELRSQVPVWAQSFGENPDSFPIPSSLPDGTTLKVDGSTSMWITNETLKARFEEQFSNIEVQLEASRTDEAIAALTNGAIDLVASGRPLTNEEKAQGLAEISLEREKLAIILGPENPFDNTLSFEQFAQIFRGEITNWAEVGGPDVAIRFVDRPAYSDTRRALSTYTVFTGKPFETGETAEPVTDDETDTVVENLAADGIGYAVVSQVIDRNDVRILSMHQTLPDDPRYPYSQYRSFVYKEDASPAVLAFLGFATTAPGQEVITDSDTAATSEIETAETDTAASGAPESETTESGTPDPNSSTSDTSASDTSAPESDGSTDEGTTALVPGSEPTGEIEGGGLPGWLPWLFGIPVAGGLLWWLLKDKGANAPDAPDAADAAASGASVPEISPQAPSVGDPSADSDPSGLTSDEAAVVTAPATDADLPGTGISGAVIGGAAAITGAAVVGAAATGSSTPAAGIPAGVSESRIVLTPRNEQEAHAHWEVTETAKAAVRAEGGKDHQLRIYDVTDIDLNKQPPHSVLTYDIAETESERVVPLPESDRDYIAEVGYRTEDGQWFDLARSLPIRASTALQQAAEAEEQGRSSLGVIGGVAAATVEGLAVAAMADADSDAEDTDSDASDAMAEAEFGPSSADPITADEPRESKLVLSPRTTQEAYASWDVPDTAKATAKEQGGQQYQLRMYDATGIDIETQSPQQVEAYLCNEGDKNRIVAVPQTERDYLAEIGYATADDGWIKLARSNPIHVSAGFGAAAIATGLGAAATPFMSPAKHPCAMTTVKVHGRHNAMQLGAESMQHLQNTVAATHQLDNGLYILRIRKGVFNYDGNDVHPGEPFVLLWIYGGTVINQKTRVPVDATWSTLNGYADTLTLNVQAPATLSAFFLDTYPDDNIGEVTLSVIKL
ncbi:MAG: DUF4912 domain-containing protein [Leptolyngbya sp. SIO1D8]|nr:DUF4912 domain-containing protein [Leptolyngbya sp. SIO1D8]